MSEKKSNLPTIIITVAVTIVIIILISNYQSILKIVTPPNPVIVSSQVDDLSTRLFEYSVKVTGVIRNDGGNGDIVFEATVYQKDKSWTKTVKKYFEAKETATLELRFDEVGWLNGEIQSRVKAYSFGK